MMEKELYQRYINREIKRDLLDSDGTLLLKKGSILTESMLSKVKVGIDKIEMVTQNSLTRQGYQRLITGTTNEIREDRVYRKGMALYDVLRKMKEDAFGKLEPTYVSTFIQKLMELSIGNKAILNDGRVAEVVFIFADEPFNPLVRLGQELIDLRKSESHIQQLLSVD